MRSLFPDNNSSQSKLIAYDLSVQQWGLFVIVRCLWKVLVWGLSVRWTRVEFASSFFPFHRFTVTLMFFSVGLPCVLSVGWRQSQNHLLQPQPAGYTSCFVLRFFEFSLSFHFSLWPNGFSLHYNTHSYQTACIFPLPLQRDKCGKPIDPTTLSCYRLDQFGQKAMVPNLLCRYRAKPTRLPCTTTSYRSQSYRHQYAIFTSVLVPVLQMLLEYYNLG